MSQTERWGATLLGQWQEQLLTFFTTSGLMQTRLRFVTLNLFQGLPELASGLKQVQHVIRSLQA